MTRQNSEGNKTLEKFDKNKMEKTIMDTLK